MRTADWVGRALYVDELCVCGQKIADHGQVRVRALALNELEAIILEYHVISCRDGEIDGIAFNVHVRDSLQRV